MRTAGPPKPKTADCIASAAGDADLLQIHCKERHRDRRGAWALGGLDSGVNFQVLGIDPP